MTQSKKSQKSLNAEAQLAKALEIQFEQQPLNVLTPSQAVAQVNQDGVESITVDNVVSKLAVKAQPKNERQARMAQKQTVDNTSVITSPTGKGGNSELLNPTPKPTKAEKPVKPEFHLVNLTPTIDGKYHKMHLASLIHLDDKDAAIPDGEKGMRVINPDNVSSLQLAYEHGDDVPPIKIAMSTHGPIILCGYHREKALLWALAEQFLDENGKIPDDKKVQYKKNVADTVILVEPINGLNVRELAEFAYFDNLKNGLSVAATNRSRFAIFLLERAKRDGVKLTVTAAAEIARCSRVAVQRQLARDSGRETYKGSLPADIVTDSQELSELDHFSVVEEAKKVDPLLKASQQLLNGVFNVYDIVQSSNDIADYLVDVIPNMKINEDDLYHALESVSYAFNQLASKYFTAKANEAKANAAKTTE